MPFFPEIHPLMPLQTPPIATLPIFPTLNYQKIVQPNVVPTQSQELQEIKGLLQNFGNKLVNIEKQQGQGFRKN